MTAFRRSLLVVAHFVCPLLFFTNLTRNPYITQISLLNVSLALAAGSAALAGAFAGRGLRLPRTPLDAPWAALAGTALLSWLLAYLGHAAFFRPAMLNEGARQALFLIVNCAAPFYLSASIPEEDGGSPGVRLGAWAAFAAAWGLLWLVYPQMRAGGGAATDLWALVWDPYGALLWAAGLAGALALTRRGRADDFLHLALAVGFLASVYAVLQFFNKECIWPSALNPYGGRSVSTFGNPNFLSSYNVVLLPLAGALFLQARGRGERAVYGAVFLALEAALLCSMTRSSWLGGALAALLLGLSPALRRRVAQAPRECGLMAALAVGMALFWPASSVLSGYTPSVIGRFAEIGRAAGSVYSPWHQRLLIWTCAWTMGAENPLTGKGWGLFELFYPFYQGPILDAFASFRNLRTHANNSHNELLETWAQTGLLGVGVLAWTWSAFFARVKRSLAGEERSQVLRLAAAAGVAGMLADNLLNVSLHFAVPAFLFWWAAGLAMGGTQRRDFLDGRRRAAGAAALLLAGGAGLAAWTAVRVWNREARYFSGFKLVRSNALPAAARQLELSRDWGPPEVNALYELGNVYARSDRWAEADKAFAAALRANAGYDEIYFNIATLKNVKLGQAEDSLRFYEMSRLINPFNNEVYNSLSVLYLREPARHARQARALLEGAVRYFPDDPRHWHNLGYLDALEERYPEAARAYGRALALAPDVASTAASLAAVWKKTGGPRPSMLAALDDLRVLDARLAARDYSAPTLTLALKIAERVPEMTKARFLAGTLLLALGRAAEAAPHLEYVAAREPRHPGARANLGAAYAALGRTKEAVEEFKAALAADPGNAAAREGLKRLEGR